MSQSPLDSMNAVACVTAKDCMVVGNNGSQPLTQTWNGTAWTVRETPAIVGQNAQLSGVSCLDSSDCVAVGSYSGSAGQAEPLAEAWNGRGWRLLPAPGIQAGLSAVSCASAVYCVAVGTDDSGGPGFGQTAAALWGGSTWRVLSPRNPGGPASGLLGVSCPAVANCVAVGYSWVNDDKEIALGEHWNGTAWTSSRVPAHPADPNPYLTGVSCPSVTSCVAVGNGGGSGGDGPVIAEAWNGTTWQQMTIPSPGGTQPALLNSVSCASTSSCQAVGQYGTGSSPPNGEAYTSFAEIWNGSTWQQDSTTFTSFSNDLLAVSCVTTSDCLAGGYYDLDNTQHQLSFAVVWNGNNWYSPFPAQGYQILQADGGVANFGTSWFGSPRGHLTGTAAGISASVGGGYVILDSGGGVANYGVPWFGSERGQLHGTTPVSIAADNQTGGYWILNANGGVANYGAPWYGSERGHLTSRPVAIICDPDSGGYWILNANGGVANYNAPWHGSERGHVTGTAVSMATDTATGGYWILDSQGGVRAFTAPWYGSERGHLTAAPVSVNLGGDGYWILNANGGVANYHVPWYGSLASTHLTSPIAGMAGQ